MSVYIQESDMVAMIPPDFFLQALDDNADGVEDVGLFQIITSQAGDDIDAFIGLRYSLPLQPPFPAIILRCARVFTAELLYLRRSITDAKNPWVKQANDLREILKQISLGNAPLNPTIQRQDPSVTPVSSPIQTALPCGSLINV